MSTALDGVKKMALRAELERLSDALDLIRQIADGLNEGAPPYHDLRLCGKIAEGALAGSPPPEESYANAEKTL